MSDLSSSYDKAFLGAMDKVGNLDFTSNEATTAVKNLKMLSECHPIEPAPDSESKPEPTTVWGKIKVGAANVWDNETTRVLIKAGGAFAGVALVTWSTIHRDHVIERTAMSQANQRNS